MPDEVAQLGGIVIGGSVILIVALLFVAVLIVAVPIPVRGPIGLVKGVDWTRVSDAESLGQFVRLVMMTMGALIAAHGVLVYAFDGDKASRSICSVVFVAPMAFLVLVLLAGRQRYHDKPRIHALIKASGKHGRR